MPLRHYAIDLRFAYGIADAAIVTITPYIYAMLLICYAADMMLQRC